MRLAEGTSALRVSERLAYEKIAVQECLLAPYALLSNSWFVFGERSFRPNLLLRRPCMKWYQTDDNGTRVLSYDFERVE